MFLYFLFSTGIYGETIDFEKEKGYALANLTLMQNCSTVMKLKAKKLADLAF